MIRAGSVTQFVLFDVAHSIDLGCVKSVLGAGASAATLTPRNAGMSRLSYHVPPLVVEGPVLGAGAPDGVQVRVKLFDYGVISVMLTRPFQGSWSDLAALAQSLFEGGLEREASRICDAVIGRIGDALRGQRERRLSEDYIVFGVTAFETPQTADSLIEHHGTDIAQVLRGERSPLGWQEVDEVLQHRLSYFPGDLIVPAWNAAFVCDNEAGVQAAHEIIEFVNSQLLEFRYYDELLEGELSKVYADLQAPRWTDRLLGRRHTRVTRRLHTLFIDVNELTDRMENAIKIVGDVYEARVVSLVAARVGVPDWRDNVQEKLKTLDDIHRFAVEQTSASRATLLETTVVLILIIELVLLLTGLSEG
jgi:hypothetical protein